jgi:hypothetical protein
MPKRYFELSDYVAVPGRWHLGTPSDPQGGELDDPWMFRKGQPVPEQQRVMIPLEHPGKPLDFSLAAFSTPVVHVRIASLFAQLAPDDVQALPVSIQGQPDSFCILVATKLIRCIDEGASRHIEIWKPEDGRPEKTGQYRDVRGLRIDPSKVGDAKVFRTWGWSVALVVREELKDALVHLGASGLRFEEV